MDHRFFRDDKFWQVIPAWKGVDEKTFSDHRWQLKNSIVKTAEVVELIKGLLPSSKIENFKADLAKGQQLTPMNVRITPYIFALIDWSNPLDDPLRKQFLPLGSQFLPDHPLHRPDSLFEDIDSPVPLLTHRYPDKVLFLPTTICPVYCSYCTRSRIIGGTTPSVEKSTYGANKKKWDLVFDYLAQKEEVEDVVISGGDAFMLTSQQIIYIGEKLLGIPHIRRIRYATKGIAIFPQKILTDDEWFKALCQVHRLGREREKQVVVHTHFSSTKEITTWSQQATQRLFEEGILVRNQAVLQEGVNNGVEEMVTLGRKLAYINISSYYVYLHDMVPGCEHFRTTLHEGVELEKAVRGTTAGFNTPTFVCDLPEGGGKRSVASYEYYDKENGISLWKAPNVKQDKIFYYFDPIHKLKKDSQKRWKDAKLQKEMLAQTLERANLGG